jgi:hypothetical protein
LKALLGRVRRVSVYYAGLRILGDHVEFDGRVEEKVSGVLGVVWRLAFVLRGC